MNMQQQRGASPAAKVQELQQSSPFPSRSDRQLCPREKSEKSVPSKKAVAEVATAHEAEGGTL
jgi:hypothetical protein